MLIIIIIIIIIIVVIIIIVIIMLLLLLLLLLLFFRFLKVVYALFIQEGLDVGQLFRFLSFVISYI